jgi:elongation factor Ts
LTEEEDIMNNAELIRELRALTSAGMKDCRDALEESAWDLQKAVDIVKIKGLNIADGRTGRVASEGKVGILFTSPTEPAHIVEINCQTDFVANSDGFKKFAAITLTKLGEVGPTFTAAMVEGDRKELVSTTKENIVVRRWQTITPAAFSPLTRVFGYQHSNAKLGVLMVLQASNEAVANSPELQILGEDLAMQACAMNPIAVSPESVPQEEKDRQKVIFETQLQEEKKPEKMWTKILEGKFRKWNSEVCLLEQDSVVVEKTAVKQVVKNVGTKLGGEIQVLSFVRYQAGEGIEKKQDNLAEEVAKMM